MYHLLLSVVIAMSMVTCQAYRDCTDLAYETENVSTLPKKSKKKSIKKSSKESHKKYGGGAVIKEPLPVVEVKKSQKPNKQPEIKKGKRELKKKLSQQERIEKNKAILNEVLEGISGFRRISDEDKKRITAKGGSADIYGEIPPDSLQIVMEYVRKPTKDDVFYDLGCGVGGAVLWVYLNFPVKKSAGIELCSSRFNDAHIALKRFKNKNLLESGRTLEILFGDMLQADLHDATIIYSCSTCFPDELMDELMEKLATLKPGLIFITLKELPANYKNFGFKAIVDSTTDKKLILPMTWSEGSPVYIYILEGVTKPVQGVGEPVTKKAKKQAIEAKLPSNEPKKQPVSSKPVTMTVEEPVLGVAPSNKLTNTTQARKDNGKPIKQTVSK